LYESPDSYLCIYQKCTAQKTQARKIRSTTFHCWKTSRNQKTSENGYLTPMTSYRSWHLDSYRYCQRDGVPGTKNFGSKCKKLISATREVGEVK
jgi:hypothetical protein